MITPYIIKDICKDWRCGNMYHVILFICFYEWLLFIIITNFMLLSCAGEDLKKVECEGILIYEDVLNNTSKKNNKEEYFEGKKNKTKQKTKKKRRRYIFLIPYFYYYTKIREFHHM
ncbi:hypothetical protein PFLG_02001, partial [Plasmodium falciparum RAJ116]